MKAQVKEFNRHCKRGVFTMVLLLAAMVTGFAQEADVLIARVKAKLGTVQDYQAEAVMKTDISFMKVPESNITVYYKKPDKFRIKKQNGISIVPKGGMNINLGALLAGSSFTAVAAGKSTVQNIPVVIVKLLPSDEKSDVVVAAFYIDEKEALIRRAIITTRENGTYEMQMSYGQYAGLGLPQQVVFTFNTKDYKLPKGLAFDYDTGEKPKASTTDANGKGTVQINYTSYTVNKGIAEAMFK